MIKNPNPPPIERLAKQRILKGVVMSDKMQKTVVVEISRMKKHSKYKKYYSVAKRFKAHNEEGVYKTGDKVLIQETKPLSKEKRWKVIGKADDKLKVNQAESS